MSNRHVHPAFRRTLAACSGTAIMDDAQAHDDAAAMHEAAVEHYLPICRAELDASLELRRQWIGDKFAGMTAEEYELLDEVLLMALGGDAAATLALAQRVAAKSYEAAVEEYVEHRIARDPIDAANAAAIDRAYDDERDAA